MVTDSGGVIRGPTRWPTSCSATPPARSSTSTCSVSSSPDEQHLALQAVLFIEHLPGLVIPAVYNPLRADGTRDRHRGQRHAALRASTTPRRADLAAAGAHRLEPPFIVVTARKADHHTLLSGGFERLTRGESVRPVVADILAELVERWPGYHAGLVMTERGRRVVHGDVPTPVRLAMTARRRSSTTTRPAAVGARPSDRRHRLPAGRRARRRRWPRIAVRRRPPGLPGHRAPRSRRPRSVPRAVDRSPRPRSSSRPSGPVRPTSSCCRSPCSASSTSRASSGRPPPTRSPGSPTGPPSSTGSTRTTSTVVAVLYLDLDNFKPINDRVRPRRRRRRAGRGRRPAPQRHAAR